MKPFSMSFIEDYLSLTARRRPDFENLLKVLRREAPNRYTLFEFYFNDEFERRMAGLNSIPADETQRLKMKIKAFQNAGYDYVTIIPSEFRFPSHDHQ